MPNLPRAPVARDNLALLETLTRINTDDILGAIGLSQARRGRGLLVWAFRRPAYRFARRVAAIDATVGEVGLRAGAERAVSEFVGRLDVVGAHNIPEHGPLLIVSNHPGMYDTIALFAAIPRGDLRVVAADRPFLRALSQVSRSLLFVTDDRTGRLSLIRAVARHLAGGGAVLTFPGGKIEPDPAVLPGAVSALADWSASMELFARLAPEVTFVPAIVSGVLDPAALRHPLTYLRRAEKDRQWLGAILQIMSSRKHKIQVRVEFGRPIRADSVGGSAAISQATLAEARRLIERATEAVES